MGEYVMLSFPGLGIGDFELNKIAFTLPIGEGISVRWYGIIITLGIVAAFMYAAFRSGQMGVVLDDLLDIAIFTVPIGVLGARLYYVIMEGGYDSFAEIINIRNGGLGIYGGIIFGALAIFGVSMYKFKYRKKKALYPPILFDAIAPGVMIAQAMGRWGNFFNGEAYGSVVPEGSPLYFLRMGIFPHSQISGVEGMAYVHPTFLYESGWNVIGFVLINLFYHKKKFDGEILLWYLSWYGFGRMFIESLRTDSLMLGNSGIRVSMLVGFLCFVLGLAIIIIKRIMIKTGKRAPYSLAVSLADTSSNAENSISDDTALGGEDSEKEESQEQ